MLDIAEPLSGSASIHALTGSSWPGAVPPLVAPGATTAAQAACGSAGPNPVLVALAAARRGVECDEVPGRLDLDRRLSEVTTPSWPIPGSGGMDIENRPGSLEREARMDAIAEEMYGVPVESMADMVAVSGLLIRHPAE